MTNTYTYLTIRHDEFRLLRLTQVEPAVTFELGTFSIDDWPNYIALSYAWGKLPARQECQCNGSPFYVSSTLFGALRNIFNDNDVTWLWVDAICINQEDELEKQSQVSQMSDVYVHADKVIVWLGEAEDDSHLAFERLPSIADRFWAIRDHWTGKAAQEIVGLQLPEVNDPVWPALLHVYARPWFHRMWIVQEVVLASHVEVLCGMDTVDWAYLVNFATAFVRSAIGGIIGGSLSPKLGSKISAMSASGIKLVMDVGNLVREYEEQRDDERWLLGVMRIMQSQTASENVDYVYGIRAMLPQCLQEKMEVDYSSQSRNNYWKLHARCFVLLLQQIDDLPRFVFPSQIKDEGRPSWCPVWGCGLNSGALPPAGTGAGRPPPINGTNMLEPLKVDLSDDCRHLMLKGASFDVIDCILPLQLEDKECIEIEDVKTLLQTITKCAEFISKFPGQYARLPGILMGNHNWRNLRSFSGYQGEDILKDLQGYLTRIVATNPGSSGGEVLNVDEQGAWEGDDRFVRAYWNQMEFRGENRGLERTRQGRLGLVPVASAPGDVVCIFLGVKAPFVLSPSTEKYCYTLKGPAFIDTVMDGELFETGVKSGIRGLIARLSRKLYISKPKTPRLCRPLRNKQQTFSIV